MSVCTLTERRLIVGVGDMKLSNRADDVIVTHALGSCIGIALYDPRAVIGGILHFMLPDSAVNPQRAQENPWMFGNVAIPLFLNRAVEMGADKRRLVIRAAGGAQFLNDKDFFAIGKRNHTMMRKVFWQQGILIKAESVGGTQSRTLYLHVGTGRVWVTSGGEEIEL